MIKYFVFLLPIMFFIASCSSSDNKTVEVNSSKETNNKYGGILRLSESEDFVNLFPSQCFDAVSHRLISNVYEGLVRLSQKDLSIELALADSIIISEDNKTYTFRIRDSVYFHEDPCFKGQKRKLSAHDIKYTFEYILNAKNQSKGASYYLDLIKGANAYYEQSKSQSNVTLSSVNVIDSNYISIELNQSYADFLNVLTMQFAYVIPKEAVEYYGEKGLRTHAVGTGPFKLFKVEEGAVALLKRNNNYWKHDAEGNKLPYLDGLKVSFIKDQKAELLAFKKGDLDVLYRLPLDLSDEVFDNDFNLKEGYQGCQLQKAASLSMEYYGFRHVEAPFDNVNLRKAMAYAVDRKSLIKYVMKGQAVPMNNGIVPYSMSSATGYDNSSIEGYVYNPQLAREYLQKAGYQNGQELGVVELQVNSGGGKNTLIAEAVVKQLKDVLDIDVKIVQMQFAQHYQNIEHGKAKFWRAGWMADIPSPENFLRLWYSKDLPADNSPSHMNTTRYKNEGFNKFLETAILTADSTARNALYAKCEQILIDDCVILPMFFPLDIRVLSESVRNFEKNPIENRDFSAVYLEK